MTSDAENGGMSEPLRKYLVEPNCDWHRGWNAALEIIDTDLFRTNTSLETKAAEATDRCACGGYWSQHGLCQTCGGDSPSKCQEQVK